METQQDGNLITVGDVVQLRSGGPKMTVLRIKKKKHSATCIWMDAYGNLQEHTFPGTVLTANIQEDLSLLTDLAPEPATESEQGTTTL